MSVLLQLFVCQEGFIVILWMITRIEVVIQNMKGLILISNHQNCSHRNRLSSSFRPRCSLYQLCNSLSGIFHGEIRLVCDMAKVRSIRNHVVHQFSVVGVATLMYWHVLRFAGYLPFNLSVCVHNCPLHAAF